MLGSILVADDDKAMLNLYTRIFSNTDCTISLASSFAEAANLINLNNYDLLITDLMFPDGLGTELIKIFEKKRAGTKSLLVTGSVAELAPDELPSVYFEKPFKLEVFMAAVTEALA
jgi:two-component system nitrogen regulation response regulator GlnG